MSQGLKLILGEETRKITRVPGTIEELKEIVKDTF
jgi:hypothetical protein